MIDRFRVNRHHLVIGNTLEASSYYALRDSIVGFEVRRICHSRP